MAVSSFVLYCLFLRRLLGMLTMLKLCRSLSLPRTCGDKHSEVLIEDERMKLQAGGDALLLHRGAYGSAADDMRLALGYIPHPQPVTVPQMMKINTWQFPLVKVQVRDICTPQRPCMLFVYPSYEDIFVSGALRWNGGGREDVHALCSMFEGIKGRADFLDVGANIGDITIPMARCLERCGHGGRIIAVEGLPDIARHLEASVLKNGFQDMTHVYEYALADGKASKNIVKMNLAPYNKGASSILGNKPQGMVEKNAGVVDGEVVEVQVTTLDAIFKTASDPKVFLMKLDVEGSEGSVINGGSHFFESHPPCALQLEMSEDWLARAGTPKASVLSSLVGYGYSIPASEFLSTNETQTKMFLQSDWQACISRFQEP
eukprot:gnl/TRDRNA2_/TRDRNA2_171245_c0_seq6.p1 gnl/TRDRNA2_/TRDRNA2_171245_c0~~gnl/TRDRNA2_/TRDRNA2_171245_c0_seq6.p1  ORF type:complete len:374 (-),score=49.43 gnl/TRDRNA2_/TRDRNA2_171245_c0_seq6:32-1153(-)